MFSLSLSARKKPRGLEPSLRIIGLEPWRKRNLAFFCRFICSSLSSQIFFKAFIGHPPLHQRPNPFPEAAPACSLQVLVKFQVFLGLAFLANLLSAVGKRHGHLPFIAIGERQVLAVFWLGVRAFLSMRINSLAIALSW